MKLKLNKKKMKSLSNDNKAIPAAMTPQVAGGYQHNYTYQGYNCTVTVEIVCTDPLTNFNCASNKIAYCEVR